LHIANPGRREAGGKRRKKPVRFPPMTISQIRQSAGQLTLREVQEKRDELEIAIHTDALKRMWESGRSPFRTSARSSRLPFRAFKNTAVIMNWLPTTLTSLTGKCVLTPRSHHTTHDQEECGKIGAMALVLSHTLLLGSSAPRTPGLDGVCEAPDCT